jgi:hypothetical protein
MPITRPPYRRPLAGRGLRQPGSGHAKSWAFGLLTLFIVASSAGLLGWTQLTRVPLDAGTSCPVAGPVGVHAVLLDQSDPITPLQAQRLAQVVDRLIDETAVGERIDLYVLTSDGTQAMTPRLSLCRPKPDGNVWTENPKRIHDRYVARFRHPLDQALKSLTEPSPTKTSPIMESVKAVCVAAFGGLPSGTPVRLTIASDMIQYSPVLDHYKQRDFETFSRTPAYNEVLADCRRARVNILYLVRPRDVRVQDRKHELFWEKFLDHVNASLTRLETI